MKQREILKQDECQPGRMFSDQREVQDCKLDLRRLMDRIRSVDINYPQCSGLDNTEEKNKRKR